MARDPVSRRRFVALAGITLSTASLAGCAENGGGGDGTPADGTPMEGGTPTPAQDGTPTPAQDGTPTPAQDGTPTPDGTPAQDGTPTPDGGGAVDPSAWEGVEEIYLDGYTEAWEGVAPEPIQGEQNPTLVLFEGNQYALTWENRDGALHDFTLWDDNQEALESTEQIDQQGETLTLEFEATQEMAQYVCTVHPNTMIGDVQIESG